MSEAAARAERPRARRGAGLLVVGGLLVLSVCWFLVFHAWWLDSDGSTYLGTGRSALHGHGFRLPDGVSPAWWNRPIYPLLIALPSRFGGGVPAAIWMSRVPLVLAAPVVAAGTLRLTRSWPAALLAGLAAIAQPWTLLAGGSNLVPDGLTAVAVVAAVVSATVAIAATSRRGRTGWTALTLVLLVLASLTKQTGVTGFLVVAILVWNARARPARWLVLVALALEGAVVFVAVVATNGAPEARWVDLPRTFVDQLRTEVFPGSPVIVLAGALSMVLVVWAVPRASRPLPLAGLTLTVAGVALGVYASGTGLQMRNAAMLPYGVALLLGALVAEESTSRRWSPAPRVALGVVLVLSLVAGAGARAYSAGDVMARNWDVGATRGVAAFLTAHDQGGPTGCTLDYCSFYWLASGDRLRMRLLPQYSARPTATSFAGLHFTRQVGFRGPKTSSPPCTGTPLLVTRSDEGFGTIFECPLLRYLDDLHPRYVVVSGSGAQDTFDAARLIPYLSSNPAFRLVYATPRSAWPLVTAVYQVVGTPQPVTGAPTYYSSAAYDALPGDHGKPGVHLLDGPCYEATIRLDLAALPGARQRTLGACIVG